MLLPLAVFVLVAGAILGGYAAVAYVPGMLTARRLDRRLRDVSMEIAAADPKATDATVVKHALEGPLPALDRLVSRTGAGSRLARLIDQSGVRTTPSAIVIVSLVAAAAAAGMTALLVPQPYAPPMTAVFAGAVCLAAAPPIVAPEAV